MNIIVVSFVANEEENMSEEIVGAATNWHDALLVAREHVASRLTYNGEVNVGSDTSMNKTHYLEGGRYVMTNVTLFQGKGQS